MKSLSEMSSVELRKLSQLKQQIEHLNISAKDFKETWSVCCSAGGAGASFALDPRDVEKLCNMLTDRIEYEIDKITGYRV